MTKKQVLEDSSAPVTALLAVVLQEYGVGVMEWEPETLKMDLVEDFGEIPEINFDKLQTGIIILSTDLYEVSWKVFETCSHFLNNKYDDIDTFNPLSAEETMAAIAEATLIKHEPLEFSSEVNAYIGTIMGNYGFCKPPKMLPAAIISHHFVKHCRDHELDDNLKEVFDAKIAYVVNYVERLHNE